jgi:hypothetical protein
MKANVTGRHGEALLSKFVICVSNNNHPESLIVGRVYRALPDEDAAKHNLIRVIDETYGEPGSEDGYLYCKPPLENEVFSPLTDDVLFRRVKTDHGGYGISWNDEIDLSESELWLHGVPAE